ncbi:MAG: site-specific integrase [bacterium]
MSGVRKTPQTSGKFQGWFVDYTGKRRFFVGTRNKSETQRMVNRLEDEHRQIRLGYLPVPDASKKHLHRPFSEVAKEYLDWGTTQGGRGGRPWGKIHVRMRKSYLSWWQERLGLKTLADFEDILPRVEKALQEILAAGRTRKTASNYREAIKTFCAWCVRRGYLSEDPLEKLSGFDVTPVSRRRAMTPEEIRRLLEVAPEHRRLLYEVALMSGLRAGELRSLTVEHLDVKRTGLLLDGEWTKNRKQGFQPVPRWLTGELKDFVDSGSAVELYRRDSRNRRRAILERPLLFVPRDPSYELEKDLANAGIAKHTAEGKVDFHSLRTTFVSLIVEAGASAKEAQTLARHSTVDLTMNVYARAREERLAEVAERLGETVLQEGECAHSVHAQAVGAEDYNANLLNISALRSHKEEGVRRFKSRPGQFFTLSFTSIRGKQDLLSLAREVDRFIGPSHGITGSRTGTH